MSAKVLYMPNLPDEQLLELMQQDDMGAFDTLYRKYWKQLYNAAYKRLGDKVACEEIVQDLFVHLYGIRHQLAINQSLIAYLHSALRNRILNFIRQEATHLKHKAQATEEQKQVHNNVELTVEYNDLVHAISSSLRHMPEKQRQVYILSKEQHLSIPEVAMQLQRPVSTVEKQLKKALHFLRHQLKDFFVLIAFLSASSF